MALPLLAIDTRTLRFSFIWRGVTRPCAPRSQGNAKLTREPGDDSSQGSFYYRSKLSALTFEGTDYLRLLQIEQSSDRCTPIGLLLETRPNPYEPWQSEEQFVFTCNEAKWDHKEGTATVTPATDDAYRLFLENYDQEYNLLTTPGARSQVTAELATLAAGTFVEFLRIDANEQADYLNTEGWTTFLVNTSWISGGVTQKGTRSRDILLFRYRLPNQAMTAPVPPGTQYTPVDMSGRGWTVLPDSEDTVNHTIDYVKTPAISGFKPYKISNYGNWNDPNNPAARPIYDAQLLLLPCFQSPADYGYTNSDYLKVTGSGGSGGGPSLGGAFNSEADGGQCLNVRRNVDQGDSEPANSKSLWWRFGQFKFGRCFPLLNGIHHLLQQTVAATGQTALLPTTPAGLSVGFSQDPNPATGETGAANELPRLLLSAGSDVKRYGASEPADRLLVSLKQVLADLAAFYDCGWFIDPATGKFRIEHRAYLETSRAAGATLDLTALPDAHLPEAYSYRTGQLPRFEELTVSNATTENAAAGIYFDKASIDYGMGGCVNAREGQNKATKTSARLTGDVAGLVLSGDAIPDSAIALLAPDTAGTLTNANQQVAASELLRRYHRRGAAAASATVAGQALVVDSVRPTRLQEGMSVPLCSLRGIDGTTHLTTSLGPDGQLAKAELDLLAGTCTLSAFLPPLTPTGPAPAWHRDFADPFTTQFS
ncbi:hypothetical protein [Hymenobacter properus]|uniref:Uncharacterized protein n=1 Tax=Hymenobacter properus TaxID=2791026 RepID=A0A931BBK2_9BACT|nr:hypothetical protein [Hymenobacter properus]MBF9140855.1 hypothetical protein [Hymenobacter properus]MBR7719664.1 hypothetical protein [Microvirga sp. SRT04]